MPPPRARPSDAGPIEPDAGRVQRLRLQDPGEHGQGPPRPGGLRPHLLGQDGPRDEGDPRPDRQGGAARQPHPVPGPGAQRRRRVLRRRRGGHPRPGQLRDRRHPHRGLQVRLRGDSQLRARALPRGWRWSTRMRAQAVRHRDRAAGPGGDRAALPAAGGPGRRPGAGGARAAPVRGGEVPARGGVRRRGAGRGGPVGAGPLAEPGRRRAGGPRGPAGRRRGDGGARRPGAAGGALRPRLGAPDRRAVHPEYVFAETATGVVVRAA